MIKIYTPEEIRDFCDEYTRLYKGGLKNLAEKMDINYNTLRALTNPTYSTLVKITDFINNNKIMVISFSDKNKEVI